jgi:hypothetical protein
MFFENAAVAEGFFLFFIFIFYVVFHFNFYYFYFVFYLNDLFLKEEFSYEVRGKIRQTVLTLETTWAFVMMMRYFVPDFSRPVYKLHLQS